MWSRSKGAGVPQAGVGDQASWQEERLAGEERFDLATAGMGRVVGTWERGAWL